VINYTNNNCWEHNRELQIVLEAYYVFSAWKHSDNDARFVCPAVQKHHIQTVIQPMTLLEVFPYLIHIVARWSGILPQVSRGRRSCTYLELITKFAFLAHWLRFLKSVPQRSYPQACLTSVVHWKKHLRELGESSSPVQ